MADNNPIRAAVRSAIAHARTCGYPNDELAKAAMTAHVLALEAAGWTLVPPPVGAVNDLDARRRA